MTMITRWSPASRDLADIDRLFDGFFGRTPRHDVASGRFAPPVDVQETADAFVIHADLPGVAQKDIQVKLEGELLTIRAERAREQSESQNGIHRFERAYGSFERTFTVTAPVRGDQVQATYKDGVLEVRLPKAEEAKAREIEVKVG